MRGSEKYALGMGPMCRVCSGVVILIVAAIALAGLPPALGTPCPRSSR